MQDHEFKLFVERVKERVAIEDVVRERIPELKRAGALWVACCPFHDEKTPSFKVDPRRGTWRCFGACGEGGDALSFLMRFDSSSFLETLEQLAQVAGLEVPRSTRRTRGGDELQERRFAVVERAERLYQRLLHGTEGAPARAYLTERGLSPNTVEAFGLGWAPARGNPLLARASQAGVDVALLAEVGLVRGQDEGRPYDFFRGRLVIPIRDRTGRPVGFGARRLADGEEARGPKYVNTPDTPLFHKGRLIYGLDRALAGVRRTRELVLVEGYTDVMAAHQEGLDQTAAVLGTATTEDHAALVRRSGARRVVLVFDGDEAGRKATERALFGLLPLDLELFVSTPPPGSDPCELIVRDGAEAFRTRLAEATAWFPFLLEGLRELPAAELASSVDGVLRLIDRLRRPVHREALVRELAAALELSEESVRLQWIALHRGRSERTPARPHTNAISPHPSFSPQQGFSSGQGAASGQGFPPGSGQSSSNDPSRSTGFPGRGSFGDVRSGAANGAGSAARGSLSPTLRESPRDRLERESYEELLGAALLDNGLVALHEQRLRQLSDDRLAVCNDGVDDVSAPHSPPTPNGSQAPRPRTTSPGLQALAPIAKALLELYENTQEDFGASHVLDALGADPSRDRVVGLEARVETYCRDGGTPLETASGAEGRLARIDTERSIDEHRRLIEVGDETQRERSLREIRRLQQCLKVPCGTNASPSEPR